MDHKKNYYTTPNPYEAEFGYHRAVRKGPFVIVSGTTAVKLEDDPTPQPGESNDRKVHFPGNAKEQAKLAMNRCSEAVRKLGGMIEDVVRVRMFVANYEDCSAVGEALHESYGTTPEEPDVGVAATMIVVPGGFVDPDMLVEVEVDAICS